jgi:hypothetical protein
MEEFKKIDEYINYSVSNFGRVRNNKKGTFLKGSKDGDGYLIVHLSKNGKPKWFKIHRLVGIAFIENVNNYETIDHQNINKLDNRVENLRWANRSQQVANRGKFKNKTSIYKGVSFNKKSNKWKSQITINKKLKYLGSFNTEIEAFECRKNYILDKNLQEFYN